MLKDLDPLLKNLPPKTADALTQAINKCGRELGMSADWVQRWIGFTVVADALASYAPDGEPAFHFKGGAAIEMRIRQLRPAAQRAATEGTKVVRPRATKDLDGRVVEHPLTKLQLEVSVYEGTVLPPDMVPAFSLAPFGLEGPEALPCIPLVKQIAQKLHAVSEPPEEGKTNERFRDLLDIVMLSAIAPPSPELRAVCEETFQVRAKHAWPPEIVTYPHWIEPMEQRAKEMGLDQQLADEIEKYTIEYVRRIANA